MKYEIHFSNGFQVIRLLERVVYNTDLTEMKMLVDGQLAKGEVNIALALTTDSYLSSQSLGVLLNCIERISDRGGHLALISPNENVIDFLNATNLDSMIQIVQSEDLLA